MSAGRAALRAATGVPDATTHILGTGRAQSAHMQRAEPVRRPQTPSHPENGRPPDHCPPARPHAAPTSRRARSARSRRATARGEHGITLFHTCLVRRPTCAASGARTRAPHRGAHGQPGAASCHRHHHRLRGMAPWLLCTLLHVLLLRAFDDVVSRHACGRVTRVQHARPLRDTSNCSPDTEVSSALVVGGGAAAAAVRTTAVRKARRGGRRRRGRRWRGRQRRRWLRPGSGRPAYRDICGVSTCAARASERGRARAGALIPASSEREEVEVLQDRTRSLPHRGPGEGWRGGE